jgi:hypothetical protein
VAITDVAKFILHTGFSNYKSQITRNPINTLQKLPYIGPITALHLAKNIGFNTSKPDRHLERLRKYFSFKDTNSLCKLLSKETGHDINLVDLILWRYLADNGNTDCNDLFSH